MSSFSNAALLATLVLLPGCGSGLAGILSSNDSSSSSSNAPPVLSGLAVESTKTTPARIRFVMSDRESDPAEVELCYSVMGGPAQLLTRLACVAPNCAGSAANPATFATTSDGIEYALDWDFTAEPNDPPTDGRFVEDVRVIAIVQGGVQEAVLGANGELGLGNDAPTIVVDTPDKPEASGIVAQRFTVADTSSDNVRIRAEYDVVGDAPDAGWRIARPGGLPPSAPTPAFAFVSVEAPPSGAELVFFWNTNVDLANLERAVVLRFTALDPVVEGMATVTPLFRIDNNDPPIVALGEGQLILNPDELRGIPIPFIVRDAESDPVRVVFQWRLPEETFPELPETREEIEALLADPVLRREHRICTEYPSSFEGRVVPIDDTTVRLPELQSSAAHLAVGGLVGRELEILRPKGKLVAISDEWGANPLVHPVGALPLGDGLTALVLDRPAPGSWRLSEIELATGTVVCVVASSSMGEPTALAPEAGTRGQPERIDSVLVASHLDGTWRVDRVALADPGSGAGAGPAGGAATVRLLVIADATTELGPIRAIASLGRDAALITVGSALVRLDYADPLAPRQVVLFDDLRTPWGVLCDPLDANRVYVAEHTAPAAVGEGRILRIELDTRARTVLEPSSASLAPPLPRPRVLAPEGARILVACEVNPALPAYALRALGVREGTPVHSLREGLRPPPASIATGADGLLLVTLPDLDRLLVAGGVEQRRTIAGYDIATGTLSVASPFAPDPADGRGWRLGSSSEPSSGDGIRGLFTWDSRDVGGGRVFFKATAFDDEVGAADESGAYKGVRSGFAPAPVTLAAGSFPTSVAAADLDQDGDLDLVATSSGNDSLRLYFQQASGVFGTAVLLSTGDSPESVAAADLDQDGDLDLVAANSGSDSLTLRFQQSPGIFGQPVTLAAGDSPKSVAAADLDQDGDLDLVAGNNLSNSLTLHFQEGPGVFAQAPVTLFSCCPSSVAAADLDQDGDIDLVAASRDTDRLTLHFQGIPGVFAQTPVTLVAGDGASSVAAADLDQDGDIDLVAANIFGDTLTLHFQEGPGVFVQAPVALAADGPNDVDGPNSVAAADLDQDGDLDLVASSGTDTLMLYFQESPGVFTQAPVRLATGDGPTSVAGDLDGDGDLDLVAANYWGGNLKLHFQEGPGVFAQAPVTLPVTGIPTTAAAADLDGDGDLDLVVAIFDGDSLTLFFQEGPGVFAEATVTLAGGIGPISVAAADLDGDGDLDLVAANFYDNSLTLHFQEGPGVFAQVPVALAAGSIPTSVAAADLDGDGDLDLVAANRGSDSLTLHFQEGPGVFAQTPVVLAAGDGTESVAAADLDQDGDLDLVSANQLSHNLTVFLQESPGVFASTPLVLGGPALTNWPVSVAAADLDGDGDVDVVAANRESDSLTLHFQEGPGVFAQVPVALAAGNSPISVVAADLDGDGDLDLVAANQSSHNLTLHFQEGPGVFAQAPVALNAGGNPQDVVAADLDGDGDLDLVAPNFFNDTLTLHWRGR